MEDDPSISIGPLKIWISGRQFPDCQDYWDGNWLNVRALCEGSGSRVKVHGAFIHLSELEKWKEDLRELHSKFEGSVTLPAIEPTLNINLIAGKSGTDHLDCEIDITGDHLMEHHHFNLHFDQSYLPGLISQLASVLREYPIRG